MKNHSPQRPEKNMKNRLIAPILALTLAVSAAAGAADAPPVAPPLPGLPDMFGYTAWTDLDWEIAQRVKRLTADELPGLEKKAAEGSPVHQTTLGLAYREGIDRATDPASGKVMRYNASNTKAVHWLRVAADGGFPIAQAELGEMYFRGHGVDRDLAEARRWLTLAARADYPRAKLDLFHLDTYETGIDVMKSRSGPAQGGGTAR